MSISIFAAAFDGFHGTPSERLVMLALSDFADDAGNVLVVAQEIGLKARLPIPETLEVLQDFVRRGVLQAQPEMQHIYRINLAHLHHEGGSR